MKMTAADREFYIWDLVAQIARDTHTLNTTPLPELWDADFYVDRIAMFTAEVQRLREGA